MRIVAVLVGSAALSVAACGTEATPERWLVYDQVTPGTYGLTPVVLETISSPRRISGEVARLRGGGEVRVATEEPQTADEYARSLEIVGDAPVDLDFFVADGVGVATDFDGLMMLTVYHHLEATQRFFASHGVGLNTVRAMDVYFRAGMDASPLLPVPAFTDNAAYAFTLDAFILPPRLMLAAGVPLFANRGVVAHEYAHMVFNRLVLHDRRAPLYLLDAWETPAVNEMRSLDEALSDLFASLATGDPDFMAPSFVGYANTLDRGLAVERHYDQELATSVRGDDIGGYDPYVLGSVVASSLWALRELEDDATLAQTVLAAERALDGDVQREAIIAPFVNATLSAWPSATRAEACAVLRTRLEAIAEEITCP